MRRFFDEYPAFYESSKTGSTPNRLNARYAALIEPNRELIAGRTVLDIASHDGRWSFAALEAGARHVIGIEARPELVADARRNFRGYRVADSRHSFVLGDVHREIERVAPDTVDVVFCFGFFYHTIHHAALLENIRRLNARTLILDTVVARRFDFPAIRLREEATDDQSAPVADPERPGKVLVGLCSRAAIELMLRNLGFEFRYHDWLGAGINDWNGIDDYQSGRRVSLVATRV